MLAKNKARPLCANYLMKPISCISTIICIVIAFSQVLLLAKELSRKGTYLTGTVRQNRPLLQTIKIATLGADSSKLMRNGEILAVAYRDGTKKVRLLSRYHLAKVSNRSAKPKVVSKCNKYMGGVARSLLF